VVILFFIHDRRSGAAAPDGPASCPAAGGLTTPVGAPSAPASPPGPALSRLARLRGPLLSYLLVTGVFSLGNSSDAFLILRARDLEVAAVMIPVLYLTFNFIYSALSVPAGIIADRIGRRRVALVGFAVFAGAYAWMATAQSQAAAWGVFAIYGVYMGIADGNGRALLAEFSSGSRRGTAFGAYHMVVGLAALPASVIAGVLYDRVSPSAPVWVGAAGAVLAGVLMLALVPEPRREQAAI
jgi:MFS family permease